jgi:mRNA-degrading endonuclease RelE of RelBE toxin-antitoxin system
MTIIMVTMPQGKRFQLVYAPVVKQHVKAIDRKHHSLIREAIESQLQVEPDVETRNRRPLKRPATIGAKWEIRFGPHNRFRVFYKVNYDDEQVEILAIGEKEGNQLLIGGEEVEL